MNKFSDWCFGIKPEWVGTVLFLFGSVSAALVLSIASTALVVLTNGYALFAIPVLFVYCLYVALFKQGDGE